MSSRDLNQGIEAIRQGNTAEGARLLRIALKGQDADALPASTRAVGYVWLAETQDDLQFKIECYQQALQIDPSNMVIRQRLDALLAQTGTQPSPRSTQGTMQAGNTPPAQAPPLQPPQQPARNNSGQNVATMQRSVGIIGGPNGAGSGFFISRHGIVATTRYVVGDSRELDIALSDSQVLHGQVVRAFPPLDLAFVRVDAQVSRLPIFANTSSIQANAQLVALVHPGKGMKTTRRATEHQSAPYWFPTFMNNIPDAGGNPVYELQNNTLVGMMTRNKRLTNGFYSGLHIAKIHESLQQYLREAQSIGKQAAYCVRCGALSQAAAYGGFYCEHCGGVLPYAEGQARHPQTQLVQLYGEGQQTPCPSCSATVGYHDNVCLRCGVTYGQIG
jgi:hypothetical protein